MGRQPCWRGEATATCIRCTGSGWKCCADNREVANADRLSFRLLSHLFPPIHPPTTLSTDPCIHPTTLVDTPRCFTPHSFAFNHLRPVLQAGLPDPTLLKQIHTNLRSTLDHIILQHKVVFLYILLVIWSPTE